MVTIVADTTSSIPVPEAKAMGIPYIPQIIVFGDQTYRDDTEMDSKTFIKRLRESSSLPKTAAPPPVLYHPVFEEYGKDHNTIIVITPSAELSGTFRSAEIAAQDFPDMDIRIIDSRTIGSGLASIIYQANRWVKQGMEPDALEAHIKEMCSRQKVYFIVDTLEYLFKGGRIGGAKMLMGSLLQVKPILTLVDGHTEAVENQRTKKKAVQRLKEIVHGDCPQCEESFLALMHGGIPVEAQALADELKQEMNIEEVGIFDLPPAILVHAGPGVIAASFFTAKPDEAKNN